MRTDVKPLSPPSDQSLAAPAAVKVKICGITSKRDVDVCARFFVDAIGLNFAQESPRRVGIGEAEALSLRAKELTADREKGVMDRIGVFVNTSVDEMIDMCLGAHLTGAQLHGEESPEDVAEFMSRVEETQLRNVDFKVIKAFRVQDANLKEELDRYPGCWGYLLDAYSPDARGGTGKSFHWDRAAAVSENHRIILAGGLTANNVATAIAAAHPYMVDTASGVEEEPRRKDHNFVLSFVQAAHKSK